MTNPFDSSAFDAATSPMFDEPVVVSGNRNGHIRRQTLTVSVFDDSTDSPVSEDSMDAEAEVISCVARRNDWLFVRDVMVRGDEVRRRDGSCYKVLSVAHDSSLGWIFKARRVK